MFHHFFHTFYILNFCFIFAFILYISTKKKGTNKIPTVTAKIIPKNTPVPIA